MNKILMLCDCKHEPCFVSKTEFFQSALTLIGKLREPHGRLYKFKSIYLDELQDENLLQAWQVINTAYPPALWTEDGKKHLDAFMALWDAGEEVFF